MRFARISAIAILSLLTTLVAAPVATADSAAVGGLVYEFDPGDVGAGATVTGFAGPGGLTLTIPDTITWSSDTYNVVAVADEAFRNEPLNSVDVGDNVVSIGVGAFRDTTLDSVTLGDSVEIIEASAFRGNEIASLTLPDSIETIGDFAFTSNVLTTVNLGQGVTSIGEEAFGLNQLAHVDVPDSVITIGTMAFMVNDLTSVDLGNGVETVGDFAFYNMNIGSVVIPDSVVTLGENSFSYNGTEDVTLGNSVATIGDHAFRNNALDHITIPDSVDSIGEAAFRDNDLQTIDLGTGVVSIGQGAFQLNAILNVDIPDNVTTMGVGAFAQNQIATVTLGTGLTDIPASAFEENLLTTVTIPDSIATIGDFAFYINDLTSVSIGDSVTTIGKDAFISNDIDSVTIPDSVTALGESAFAYNGLSQLTLGSGLTAISRGAFTTNDLTSVTIPDGVTVIEESAFLNNDIEDVTIPANVTSIEAYAFWGNAHDEVLFLGAAPSALGEDALGDTTEVTVLYNVQYGEDVVGLGGFTTPTWEGYDTAALATVSFDMNGFGAQLDPVDVVAGGELAPPTAPTETGYTFTGWFEDASLDTEYDFSDPVTDNFTLYAGWEINTYDVVLVPGLGQDEVHLSVDYGESIADPVLSPEPGWSLEGWFNAYYGGDQWDFASDTVSDDLILYAQWTSPSFSDVAQGHPFYDEVRWMSDYGISTGYDDGTFRPSAEVSRQAMSAFLYRAAGEPEFTVPFVSPFDDVPTTHPFYVAIAWMDHAGISTGYDDGTFRAGDVVTRQAMSAFMYRAAGEPAFTQPWDSPFDDVEITHPFYKEIAWMDDEGISTGYDDGTFRPNAPVSRQAMSAFMFRLYVEAA